MKNSLSAAGLVLAAGAVACAQPANDNCANAEAISGFGTFSYDNTLATADGVDNSLCNFSGSAAVDHDIWYCWAPPGPGPVRVTTCGAATNDTKIAVYDGCSCPEGSGIVACSDDNCALQTTVAWVALPGHTYLIRMGTYINAAGAPGAFTTGSGILHGPIVGPSGHSYSLLDPMNWTAGEAAAVAMGGHLATVNDAAENEFLRAQILGFDGADRRGWIGLTDDGHEGTFTWTSGEPLIYTNWNGGEPNNTSGTGGPENFVEMFGSNGQWNDTILQPPFSLYPLVEVAGPPACYANCDGSTLAPILNVNDFLCFNNRFQSGDTYANCDGSTLPPVLNVNDFLCFNNSFAAGCGR